MTHHVWYDRDQRMWCSQWKDAAGTQLGQAEWYPTKAGAMQDPPPCAPPGV